MERVEGRDMMGELKFYGMKAAHRRDTRGGADAPARTAALHRRPAARRDFRSAGAIDQGSTDDRQAAARLAEPCGFRWDIDEFAYKDTPINEVLVRALAGGAFMPNSVTSP